MFVDNRSFINEKLFNKRTGYLTGWPSWWSSLRSFQCISCKVYSMEHRLQKGMEECKDPHT